MEDLQSIPNKSCNLECLKGKKEVGEFTGLVKIVLVNTPRSQYCIREWWAGFVGLAYIMMGGTISTVFFFCLAMKLSYVDNLHVLLCALGFQLLIPSGILMFSNINGPSVPMTELYRKVNHVLIQFCGLVCGLGGAIIVIFFGKQNFISVVSVHSVIGSLTCILAVIGALFGPCLLCLKKENVCGEIMYPIHKSAGSVCFFISSICFITGLMKPSFTNWLPVPEMRPCLITFCVLYTLIIVSVPFIRCLTDRNAIT